MLTEIYAPVAEELTRVEERLKETCRVDSPVLAQLLERSLGGGGKRVRPALVLLAGRLYNCRPERLLPMAAAVEVLHTATLVHDDAIDNSPVRHGRPTINREWGDDRAILLGDYLLAQAEALVAETENPAVIKMFAASIMTLCGGELNQSFAAFDLEQTEESYIDRIAAKTASLIMLATQSGAVLGGAPEESVKALKNYGYNLGVAFQIVDDILDFTGDEEEMGKPIGSDLAEGTLTLPAMLLLKRSPGDDNPARRLFRHQGDAGENIKSAIEQVGGSSIIDDCYQLAADYIAEAKSNLGAIPDNVSRRSLTALADYVMARKK